MKTFEVDGKEYPLRELRKWQRALRSGSDNMKHLIIIILLLGCTQSPEQVEREAEFNSTYQMRCAEVRNFLERCENQEAVCYYNTKLRAGGLVCKFKAWGEGVAKVSGQA